MHTYSIIIVNKKVVSRMSSFVLACLLLTGCQAFIYPQAAPYRNFHASEFRGDIANLPPDPPEVLLGYATLPNGHIENKMGSRGQCIFIFEVDPNSRRIVGWRFEYKENEQDCINQHTKNK